MHLNARFSRRFIYIYSQPKTRFPVPRRFCNAHIVSWLLAAFRFIARSLTPQPAAPTNQANRRRGCDLRHSIRRWERKRERESAAFLSDAWQTRLESNQEWTGGVRICEKRGVFAIRRGTLRQYVRSMSAQICLLRWLPRGPFTFWFYGVKLRGFSGFSHKGRRHPWRRGFANNDAMKIVLLGSCIEWKSLLTHDLFFSREFL